MKVIKELNIRICHMDSDVGRRPASYPLDLRVTLRQVEKGLSLGISGTGDNGSRNLHLEKV